VCDLKNDKILNHKIRRNQIYYIVIFVLTTLVFCGTLFAQGQNNSKNNSQNTTQSYNQNKSQNQSRNSDHHQVNSHNANFLLKFYQKHISVVDGNRCAMYPSCSHYASQAMEKHGVILGWIMANDRLVRCGRDEADIAPKIILNNQILIYDPVESNDFWWFGKKKKQ